MLRDGAFAAAACVFRSDAARRIRLALPSAARRHACCRRPTSPLASRCVPAHSILCAAAASNVAPPPWTAAFIVSARILLLTQIALSAVEDVDPVGARQVHRLPPHEAMAPDGALLRRGHDLRLLAGCLRRRCWRWADCADGGCSHDHRQGRHPLPLRQVHCPHGMGAFPWWWSSRRRLPQLSHQARSAQVALAAAVCLCTADRDGQ